MNIRQVSIALLTLLVSPFVMAADILTTVPATHILATQLTQGTPIEVKYLPPARYGVSRLESWFSAKGEEVVEQEAPKATAVITIRSLWPQDPSYAYLRDHNIRLVEVDASQSISSTGSSVAALTLDDGSTSIYAWLNPNNLGRMSKIIADDLIRLWPQHKTVIHSNLQQALTQSRKLIQQQSDWFFEQDMEAVVLLSESLEDFAAGYQLFVVGRQYKAELDWTTQDIEQLKGYLNEDPTVRVVTTRKVSEKLANIVGDKDRIIEVDSLDRMGRFKFKADSPLERWESRLR
ncbi:zinc ABC transporter substrate-binding protein [Vibrio sp. SCSIO 43136]|uniref:metal ABC transporter solute-binding protein, Zn/Mn family n=1 Tax=Vibrio sp. SCSIO 43136 TaxID=2819101 RepID=UPI0020762D7D|nr:zinc ABC transporter substrate-binding protein [Vibrio sp. SCSIO 43136]USD67105.1 zinc ABC transporter substrate-binding protein [Vibrio sp. SCSIO 43136]